MNLYTWPGINALPKFYEILSTSWFMCSKSIRLVHSGRNISWIAKQYSLNVRQQHILVLFLNRVNIFKFSLNILLEIQKDLRPNKLIIRCHKYVCILPQGIFKENRRAKQTNKENPPFFLYELNSCHSQFVFYFFPSMKCYQL